MIQPEEIKKQALRWYPAFLTAIAANEPFFPKDIRFGKVKASETLAGYRRIKEEITVLINGSRERLGYGYSLEFTVRRDRKTGEQQFPQRIWFAAEEDYIRSIGKDKEVRAFKSDVQEITSAIPGLRDWVLANPIKVIEQAGTWRDLITVCDYFIDHPRPHLYIRELPLELPTKFVEEHRAILRQLLDVLIPEQVNSGETEFEKRFHLKYDEPLIRFLILDEGLVRRCFNGLRDISIPQYEFHKLSLDCTTVLILENKTNFSNIFNFLTLPEMEKTIAVFGKGFQIALLKEAAWLTDKRVIYWGDIDAHGFQILSQLRSYFPQTRSLMMDRRTFDTFRKHWVIGTESGITHLPHLTTEENELFNHLLNLRDHNRLEQEKISHPYAVNQIHQLFSSGKRAWQE